MDYGRERSRGLRGYLRPAGNQREASPLGVANVAWATPFAALPERRTTGQSYEAGPRPIGERFARERPRLRSLPSAAAIAPLAWNPRATLRRPGRVLSALLAVAALSLMVLAQSYQAGAFSAELSSTHSDEASPVPHSSIQLPASA